MLMIPETIPSEQKNTLDPKELAQLIFRIAAGERPALAELYERSRAAVYALALSYLKNVQDAQDVTQDTFVQVWENAEAYRSTGSAAAWLLTICRNLALMKLRSDKRKATLDSEEWDAIPADAGGVTPEERALLQGILARLDAQERRVVLLHAVAGLKHREIAALMELPIPTVLSKYHRALKKMRALMEGDDER